VEHSLSHLSYLSLTSGLSLSVSVIKARASLYFHNLCKSNNGYYFNEQILSNFTSGLKFVVLLYLKLYTRVKHKLLALLL